MTDLVHYQLPFGGPGHLMLGRLVARRLEAIFNHRARVLDELFR